MTEAAFSAYVAARRPQLFRTACLLCGDPHRAEDVVQDALVRLYAAWDRVARMDNVDGYVRRIIVNADYSDRRRPWRRERATEPRDVPLDPAPRCVQPRQSVLDNVLGTMRIATHEAGGTEQPWPPCRHVVDER